MELVGTNATIAPTASVTFWRSLLLKNTLFVAGLVVVSTTLLGHLAYVFGRSILLDRIHDRMALVASDRAFLLESYERQQLQQASLIANRALLRELTLGLQAGKLSPTAFQMELRRILEGIKQNDARFQEIWIADTTGKVIASTDQKMLDLTFADDPAFLRGQKRAHLDKPQQVEGLQIAYLSCPVRNEISLLGVLMIRLDVSPIVDLLTRRSGLGDSGEVLVGTAMDDNVAYLLPSRHGIRTVALAAVDPMARAVRGESGAVVSRYDGVPVLAAYRPVSYQASEDTPWGLVAKMDLAEAYAPMIRLRNALIAVQIALVLVGTALSFLVAQRFTRPILRLASASKEIASGNLRVQVPVNSRDEVGVLGDSFNRMAAQLVESRDSLEQRIDQRTAELQISQRELRRQTRILQSILDSMGDGVIVADQHGRFLLWNPAAKQIVGIGPQETPPDTWTTTYGFFLPDGRACPPQDHPLVRAMGGQSLDDVEMLLRNPAVPDGTWISATARPLRNDRGQLRGGVLVLRDISAARKVRVELRNSDAKNRAILAAAHEAFIGIDASSTIVEWNVQAEATFGWQRSEALGRTLPETIIPVRFHHKHRRGVERFVKTGEGPLLNRRLELCAKHRDGHEFPVEVTITAIPQGDDWLFTAFVHDISERKAAEEAALRLAAIVDQSDDPIIGKTLEGAITSWNRAAERVYGFTAEEAIGKSIDLLIPEDHPDELAWILNKLRRGEVIDHYETVRRRRDGERLEVSLTISPIRDKDGITSASAISRDITEQKKAAAELERAKQQAESANRAKSAFLATMSHEIRTPMNAIIGMTDLLLDSELTPTQRDCLTMVQDSGESLLAVINEILDFSKIEAGRFELDSSPFDLSECLGDTMKSLAVRAHHKNLELAFQVDPHVPEFVVGDRNRLRQIIINLVGNAIKFTEAGEVVLTVDCRSSSADKVELHFAVRDTGVGIPVDKQEQIFKAFEQADESMSRRYAGTGLGLTISSRLVEMMGGKIWVESQPGQGSTFHFTANFELARHAVAAPEVEATEFHELRALIVDDNTTNCHILESMLQTWGMRADWALSAAPALERMRRQQQAGRPFDLVLVDSHMPEMDGFALVEAIRGDHDLNGSIIMMLSSSDRPDEIERCREMGISVHLIKPVKRSELFNAIADALGLTREPKLTRPARVSALLAQLPPMKVLLVEDSLANQKLARALLEPHGHTVTIANNGREAVETVKEQGRSFDLVLMDVQMPEMDGLEATRQIREYELGAGGHVPIVAMTAHALKGDRDLCLAAGMDAYIAKPVRVKNLYAAIRKLVAPQSDLDPTSSGESKSSNSHAVSSALTSTKDRYEEARVLDWERAVAEAEVDLNTLREMGALFLAEAPKLVAEAHTALNRHDTAALRRAAHTLKGSAALFAAERLRNAAFQLEQLAKDERYDEASAAYDALEREVARAEPVLASFVQ